MPVRALRLLGASVIPRRGIESESINAREGIKTLERAFNCPHIGASESINAREGIKTLERAFNCPHIGASESINAREGIKTQERRSRLTLNLMSQNQ